MKYNWNKILQPKTVVYCKTIDFIEELREDSATIPGVKFCFYRNSPIYLDFTDGTWTRNTMFLHNQNYTILQEEDILLTSITNIKLSFKVKKSVFDPIFIRYKKIKKY